MVKVEGDHKSGVQRQQKWWPYWWRLLSISARQDPVRRWPEGCLQGSREGLMTPDHAVPWPWTLGLQNCEMTTLCGFKGTVYAVLLWQPELTKAPLI
jgi:hypothetical protein